MEKITAPIDKRLIDSFSQTWGHEENQQEAKIFVRQFLIWAAKRGFTLEKTK